MTDDTFIDWPFFDSGHREWREGLLDWCGAYDFSHGDDVDADCRRLVADLGAAGWLRAAVPGAAGGLRDGLDVRSIALTRETLAFNAGLADFAFAMQGLGSGPVSLFGDATQRERYLSAVCRGEKIAAFALSEADAGSDVAALATTAVADGDDYVINGEKMWISNGGIADFYCVFARTGEAPGARGLSAFIVDADTPGFTVTERIETIAPHPLGRLAFEDCRVAAGARIGSGGDGFRIAMATLDVFRTSVGAAALGFARRAFDEALRHSSRRQLFGAPLGDLQMTQARLADMAVDVDASALLVYRSAWAKDCYQQRVTREAAMAKLFATEAAQRVIDGAVQLFGGRGVVSGNIVETLYREIRALRIYEGASEVQKVIIARQAQAGERK